MSENTKRIPIYCGDHHVVVVDLSSASAEERRFFLNAYVGVSGATVLNTKPTASDGGSVAYEKITRLEIPTDGPDAQITRMHTVAKLIEFSGMVPKLSLNKPPEG